MVSNDDAGVHGAATRSAVNSMVFSGITRFVGTTNGRISRGLANWFICSRLDEASMDFKSLLVLYAV